MLQEVIVKISPDGSTTETIVNGVTGPRCEDLTKALLNAIGEVSETKKLPEYYQAEVKIVTCENC